MRKKPSRIAPILKTMAKDIGLEAGLDLYGLQSQWRTLVSPSLAAHTFPQAIQHKTLVLQVDSAPWMHELTYLKGEILQKVNRALGKSAIESIRLKMARIESAAAPTPPPRPKRKILSEDDRDLIRRQLDAVSDDALKDAIRKAMSRHLRKEEPA